MRNAWVLAGAGALDRGTTGIVPPDTTLLRHSLLLWEAFIVCLFVCLFDRLIVRLMNGLDYGEARDDWGVYLWVWVSYWAGWI